MSTPTLIDGWTMPTPPSSEYVPAYYLDSGEIWLGWVNPTTGEPHQTKFDISWPWQEADLLVNVKEFQKLGFQDADEMGPEEPPSVSGRWFYTSDETSLTSLDPVSGT